MSFFETFKNFKLRTIISLFLNLITSKEISKISLTLIKNVFNHDLHEDKDYFYNVSF